MNTRELMDALKPMQPDQDRIRKAVEHITAAIGELNAMQYAAADALPVVAYLKDGIRQTEELNWRLTNIAVNGGEKR